MKKIEVKEVKSTLPDRRSFLKLSGLTLAGAGLIMAGCSSDDDKGSGDNELPGVRDGKFDLGGGDLGILTYAYALEQLEADFYTRVVNGANFNTVFSEEEREVLTDLYYHEVVHREFFQAALSGELSADRVLPDLQFSYGSLNFSDRNQVLTTARTLEDTGVAAYNGAGRYLSSANYLLVAGKIVSVEARHASAIRSLLSPGTGAFAGDDVVTEANGLGQAKKPSEIISAVSALNIIQTPFTANYLD